MLHLSGYPAEVGEEPLRDFDVSRGSLGGFLQYVKFVRIYPPLWQATSKLFSCHPRVELETFCSPVHSPGGASRTSVISSGVFNLICCEKSLESRFSLSSPSRSI